MFLSKLFGFITEKDYYLYLLKKLAPFGCMDRMKGWFFNLF